MEKEKYVKMMGTISLVLSIMGCLFSLCCMVGYILGSGSTFFNIVLLPLLIICVFITAITLVIAFINLNSTLGKYSFIICLLSSVFVIVSFILLYR